MSGGALRPDHEILDAERGGVLDVGDHPLVRAPPRASAIELAGGHPAHRDVPLLGQSHDGGQPLVGARRHADRRHAPGAQRFEHRVDAVDAHRLTATTKCTINRGDR